MFELYRTILQLLKSKDIYDKIRSVVTVRLLDNEVRRVVSAMDTYWKNYPSHSVIQPDVLMSEICLQNEDLSDDDQRKYASMLDVMMQEPEQEAARGIIRSLRTVDFSAALEKINDAYNEGADLDLFEKVESLCKDYGRDLKRDIEIDYIKDSITEIIKEETSGHRFSWALACLNGALPNVRTGKQYILAARPGKGKTSFCAANAVHMASCTPDDRPIIWFNNEGKGRIIKGTTYRAALRTDFDGIIELGAEEASRIYSEVVGGPDRIRIFDIHGRDYKYLERIIDEHRPAVVFFDMLDNVKGFGDAARTDLRLEELYQWARESAVIYDFLSIPTKQVSVEGADTAWVPESALKDSKTGVQGACDGIITMGSKNGAGWENSRFLYVPKSKDTPAPGYLATCMKEVIFDGARCTFVEAVEASADRDLPA